MVKVKKTEPASPEEINLLRALEKSERTIGRLVGKKEADVEEHNAGIKDAKRSRREILDAIVDYRNGVRALPLE